MRVLPLLLVGVVASPAFGQQAEMGQGSADDIVVTATGKSAAVSTTKSAQAIIEAPQTISIISKEELDLRPSPNLTDALAYTAGVQTATLGTDSRVDNIVVRGFSAGGFSASNNFVDGLRLPAGGQFTRISYDTYALEQIEVLKGPSGALYGQSAPGGMVNLVSKRPTDKFRAEFLLQGVGYFNLDRWNGQAAVDVSGPITDGLSGRIVALSRYGQASTDQVTNARRYISPSLTWKNDSTSWTLLGQYQRDEGGATFQFLPELGTRTPSNGRVIRNGTLLGEPNYNAYDRDQYLIASFFEHRFSDHFAIRNNSRYAHLYTYTEGAALGSATITTCPASIVGCVPGQTVTRRGVQSAGSADGYATDTQLEAKFVTGSIAHTVLAGVDYFRTDYDFLRTSVAPALVLPILNIFDPVYRGSAGYNNALSPLVSTEGRGDQWGAYLQDQIAVGGLRVTVGGRKDWTKDDTLNRLTNRRFINKNDAFTWRAGAVYLFDNGLAPYVSYAESFQPQVSDTSTSLNGETFVPTTGQQYEVGLRYQSGNNIYLTIGAYQITQQNITTPDPGGTLCGTAICLVQTGEARVRGAEFEAKGTLSWGTTLIGSVTYNDSEVTKSTSTYRDPSLPATAPLRSVVGNRLPTISKWLASLLVSQTFKEGSLAGLGIGGGVRYVSGNFGDAANLLGVPGATVFDAFFRYDLGAATPALQGVSFSVYARNIANKTYLANCSGTSSCFYADGRSVTARLQFRW